MASRELPGFELPPSWFRPLIKPFLHHIEEIVNEYLASRNMVSSVIAFIVCLTASRFAPPESISFLIPEPFSQEGARDFSSAILRLAEHNSVRFSYDWLELCGAGVTKRGPDAMPRISTHVLLRSPGAKVSARQGAISPASPPTRARSARLQRSRVSGSNSSFGMDIA